MDTSTQVAETASRPSQPKVHIRMNRKKLILVIAGSEVCDQFITVTADHADRYELTTCSDLISVWAQLAGQTQFDLIILDSSFCADEDEGTGRIVAGTILSIRAKQLYCKLLTRSENPSVEKFLVDHGCDETFGGLDVPVVHLLDRHFECKPI